MPKIRITSVSVAAVGAALAVGAMAGPAFASTPHYGPPTQRPDVPAWCGHYQDNGKGQKWNRDNDRNRCCPETIRVIVRGHHKVDVVVLDTRNCINLPPKQGPGPQPGPSWKPQPTPTWTHSKDPKPGPTWTQTPPPPNPHPTWTHTPH